MKSLAETHRSRLSRRDVLVPLVGVTTGAILPALSMARTPAVSPTKGKIDVHFHLGLGQPSRPGQPPSRFLTSTPAFAVEEFDRCGTQAGIISVGSPAGIPRPPAEQIKWARERNERHAKVIQDYPGRFGAFAALPLPEIDASLEEIDYALNTLKADGIGLVTNYGDTWLGDPKFEPLFEELNRVKAVVFVHPTDAPCCTGETLSYMGQMKTRAAQAWIEWPMNTARSIFSLLLGGTIRRFPNIRFIFSHGGGAITALLPRIAAFKTEDTTGAEQFNELFPTGVESEFRKLYFDIAVSAFTPPNFEALSLLVSTSQLLYGSDYPFMPMEHSAKGLEELGLSANVRRQIERENAVALLPRWQA